MPQGIPLLRGDLLHREAQHRRRGIFRQFPEDVAPDGALAVNELLFYKDASPDGL